MFPIVLAVFVLIFFGLISYIKIRLKYKFAEKLPGPGIPFFGILFEVNGMSDES